MSKPMTRKQQNLQTILCAEFGKDSRELFLQKELERYIPQLEYFSDSEIYDFFHYQHSIYLDSKMPLLGKPIASLNPTFIDSIENLVFSHSNVEVYTRASTKENGYRMQLHISLGDTSAFTRQFTRYDLRLLPELNTILKNLPVMIGDCELINRNYSHLAGFNRLQKRIPDARYWPKKGEKELSSSFVNEYLLRNDLFLGGKPKDEFICTLAFHGLFAIADSATWEKSRDVQEKNLTSLCDVPMNYQKVDMFLDELTYYLEKKQSSARVVDRKKINNSVDLSQFIKEKELLGLEGVCVVQSANLGETRLMDFAKSYKIKKYETVDAVVLGLYVSREEDLREENIQGALLGVYDSLIKKYLPLCKVNLDPEGVQIKTKGQHERLSLLRKELFLESKKRSIPDENIMTLQDVYFSHGKILLESLLEFEMKSKIKNNDEDLNVSNKFIDAFFSSLPRGKDFLQMIEEYDKNKRFYDSHTLGKKKSSMKTEQYISQYVEIFSRIQDTKKNIRIYSQIMKYFAHYSEIKKVSIKLVKPDFLVATKDPIIVELQVFDSKFAKNPYSAGFHPRYGDSFQFRNIFAERMRYDKSTTTDYETIVKIARKNTVK